MKECKITTVIVTFNPNILRLDSVLTAASELSDNIIIIDNASSNIYEIMEVAKRIISNGKLLIKKLSKNKGIACALNIALKLIIKNNFSGFALILDQDSVPLISREEARNLIAYTFDDVGKHCGILALSDSSKIKHKPLYEIQFTINSGMIIDTDIFYHGIRYREEFFMDQVDFDFCYNVGKLGYKIFATNKKYLDHILGDTKIKLGRKFSIENNWRLYLLIRNSTILLKEKKISLKFFLKQIGLHFFTRFLVLGFNKDNISLPKIAISALIDGVSGNVYNNFKYINSDLKR